MLPLRDTEERGNIVPRSPCQDELETLLKDLLILRFRHNFVLNSNSLASRVIKFYVNIEILFDRYSFIYIYRLMRKFSH